MASDGKTVRLTPELQAEYQQIYNDPAKKGSPEWYVSAKGLAAAGVITPEAGTAAEMTESVSIAETNTEQQTL